jgi:hypothetical protein
LTSTTIIYKRFSASIKAISFTGIVTILLDESIDIPPNYMNIDESVLNIQIINGKTILNNTIDYKWVVSNF